MLRQGDRSRPGRRRAVVLVSLIATAGCSQPADRTPAAEPEDATAEVHGSVFEDASSRLPFVHFNGMSGRFLFPEMTGGGAALADFDGDGDLDVYFVQGETLGAELAEATPGPQYPLPLADRLYSNQLVETGSLRFVDATEGMGVAATGYGMGVAAGDVDNDGLVDLYVTNFGPNRLLINRGGGLFEDVTTAAAVDDPRWSVPATFLDFDRDGWLDLFVGNYVDYTVATNKRCRSASGALDYCGPHSYPPVPDRLFRNRGDGSFEDVTAAAGVDRAYGAALGVVAADFDGDGWGDLYVANDGSENQLWHNQGDGTFAEVGLVAGSALNGAGETEAGMGVDAGDFDNDGDEDLFVAHLTQETSTLYRNLTGDGGAASRLAFADDTVAMGLGQPTWQATGFGAAWLDYDNDGWLDLLMTNGAVKVIESLARAGEPYPLHQPNQLFHNRGGGGFVEATVADGALARSAVSRGAAVGDVDNDGDLDVVVANNSGPADLLLNRGSEHGWLGLRLRERSGRSAIGARVVLELADGTLRSRDVSRGGGYASANDPRVLFGLGTSAPAATGLQVRWADGVEERHAVPPVGEYTTLRRGEDDAL